MQLLSEAQVLTVTGRYGVHPAFVKDWLDLLNTGQLNYDLGVRIATCDNYRDALHDLLEIR